MNWYKVLKIVIVSCLVSFHSTRATPPEIDIQTDPSGKPTSITIKSEHLFMRNITAHDLDCYTQIFSNIVTMEKYMEGIPRPTSEICKRHEKYLSWWRSGNPYTSYLVYLNEETASAFLEDQNTFLDSFSAHLSTAPVKEIIPFKGELRGLDLSRTSFKKEFDVSERIFMGHVLLEKGTDRALDTDAEISYVFLPAFWGKGYGTEAVENIIELAKTFHQRDFRLESHPIDTLIATALPENPGSCKVLEKNGFTFSPLAAEKKFGAPRRLYIRPLLSEKQSS